MTPVKKLFVENLSHPDIKMNIVSLDPPPLELDRRIEGLKRLELNIPSSLVTGGKIDIKIRLKGQKIGVRDIDFGYDFKHIMMNQTYNQLFICFL